MTQKQLIETVQQHHPNLGETQIRIFLNKALDEFCRKTRILKSLYTFSTVANQRYYDLDDDILEVTRVDYDNYAIPRLVEFPEKIDTDS
jgi:hypothetical protein|tara:strand:- start:479 stop:745 length:267 start_codon:yes stop_codon:yes gene_type:complete